MLVCNNNPVNWEKPETPNEKWVAEGIQYLLDNKKRLFFERVVSRNDIGIQISRPPNKFSLIAKRVNPKTRQPEEWKYTQQGLYDDKKKLYAPQRMTAGLDIDLRVANNPELAFFFYSIFKDGAGKVGYILRDWDKEAEEKNQEESLEFMVGDLIFNKMSESDINLRCYAWGVPTEDKGFELKKRDLYSKVKLLNKNKTSALTYQSFIDGAKQNSEGLKLQAYVAKAFRDNILYLDNLIVRYRNGDLILCSIPVNKLKDYVQFVAEWLENNDAPRDGFISSMQGVIEDIAVDAVDYDNVTNVQKLRSIAIKSYRVPPERLPSNAKGEDIKAIIREYDPRLLKA